MTRGRLLLLLAGASTAFVVGYGTLAVAWPTPYSTGYFTGVHDNSGTNVWQPDSDTKNCKGDGTHAIPSSIDTVNEFIDFVECKLTSTNSYGPWKSAEKTGAAFLIQTMIQDTGSKITSVNDPRVADWEARLQYASSKGWIKWSGSYSYSVNSYFQGSRSSASPNDDAFYSDSGSAPSITFMGPDGKVMYAIRRQCANPVGQSFKPLEPPPSPPPADFALAPSVTTKIESGGTTVSGNIAEPGDTVTFTYAVRNSGATDSPTTTCTYRQETYAGYNTDPPTSTFTPSGANCAPSRTFKAGTNTTVATETISGSEVADGTSICRSLTVEPASNTNSGASAPAVACVLVAAKPFARVYGGDVAAGAGVVAADGTCATNDVPAIIGWNKGNSPGYDGAGVQFAAYALSTILDVATSAGNGAGAAAPPAGLSFANTSTNPSGGEYGGSFGSVPCIPDYFGELPAAYNNLGASSSAALASGVYYRGGDLQITGGAVGADNRVSVFVKGNVYISGDIKYGGSGSWTSSNIPLFQLIVSGNIYIAPGVTQLDGLYVAQSGDGTTNGVIYTCASGLAAPVALTSLATSCGTTLTVNGGFVARYVELMRTAGSLGNGTPAEVFNYNPALWIAQPAGLTTGTPSYDSITSLPPVL